MIELSPKRPDEIVTASFDFTPEVTGVLTITDYTVSIAQFRGRLIDPDVSTMKVGSPSRNGTVILQHVGGGKINTDYLMVARVTLSGGQVYEIASILPVRVDND